MDTKFSLVASAMLELAQLVVILLKRGC